MPEIILKTTIDASIQTCFDLARSIDLHKISTHRTKEYVIAGRKEGLIKKGETVTWRAKHFGIWQNLTVQITAFEEPKYFCDEMKKGIFKNFKHDHIFEEKEGRTIMIDRFNFESPLGILGEIFNTLVLTNYMKKFLEKRNEVIKEYAEQNLLI